MAVGGASSVSLVARFSTWPLSPRIANGAAPRNAAPLLDAKRRQATFVGAICVIFFCLGGNLAMAPTVTSTLFGTGQAAQVRRQSVWRGGAARAHGRPVGSSRPSGGRRQPPTVRTRRRRAGWRRANDSAPSRSDPRDEEERTARPPPPVVAPRGRGLAPPRMCRARRVTARSSRACLLAHADARAFARCLCSAPGVLPA